LLLVVVEPPLGVGEALSGVVETACDVAGVLFCAVEVWLCGFDLKANS
jgi:hypothetical protein